MFQPGTLVSRIAALGILIVVIAIGWSIVIGPLSTAYGDAADDVRRQRGQLAALQNRAMSGELQSTLTAMKEQIAKRGLLLEDANDGAAAAKLQQTLVGLLEQSGGSLSSVQALPTRAIEQLKRIGLRLQFSADPASLQKILYGLEFGQPVIVLENVFVHARTDRAVGLARPLTVRLDVFAFLPGEVPNAGP